MIKTNRHLIIATVVGILSIACLLLLYRQITFSSMLNHETRSHEALTEILSNAIRSEYRDLIDVEPNEIREMGEKHPVILRLDAEVKRLMRGTMLLKIKIYNLDGTIIFSTDPSQINQNKSNNAGFLGAKTGKTMSKVTFRDQFDAFEGLQSNINVVSSYIPVGSRPLGETETVFEVYSDVTELINHMRSVQWYIVIGVLGSVAIF